MHRPNPIKRRSQICRILVAATFTINGLPGSAEILDTKAAVRPDNALIVDIQVKTAKSAAKLAVTYHSPETEALASPWIAVDPVGVTTITIGRLRASKTYSYTVRAIDGHGAPAGTTTGSFTTGALPAALSGNIYKLRGRSSVPVIVLPHIQTGFRGYVGLDLHSADAPQIVWYYQNAPSNASGALQSDVVNSIISERHGDFLFADAGSGPPPLAADGFLREIAPDGTIVAESPQVCRVTTPDASPAANEWIWAQGNDSLEQLETGADGVPGTVLHTGKIVKDPFFDAGLAPQGARLQTGIGIRRWNRRTGKDELVWDPFKFLDPLNERTTADNSDPGNNSDTPSPFPCGGKSLQVQEWLHSNSLQLSPAGSFLMSLRLLDTVIAISPEFDQIAWRIGRFGSDFAFPDPSDHFYHQHYVRMLENGNLLLFDNGNGRPAAEGGTYSRALELSLDWDTMTACKVWEYKHPVTAADGSQTYKYVDAVGTAHRLENGNTLVLFGTDVDPVTLAQRNPRNVSLVEADGNPEAGAVAVLDFQMTGGTPVYRALPVKTLFGEVAATSGK